MAVQRFVVLFLVLVSTSCAQYLHTLKSLRRFSCSQDAREQPLNLSAMSGYWYEAARIPNMDIMKCLNVSVPPTADGKLKLRLEYISTIHGEIHAVKETVSFPWNNFTKTSVFQLHYKTVKMNVTVTYKVLYSDPQLMIVLCGYSTISPFPLFKLLTRQRRLDQNLIDIIKADADRMGIGSQIIWTEQSPDQCSAANRLATKIIIIFSLISLLNLFNWNYRIKFRVMF
ncbi:uncharacterized protein Dmoj_GI25521, isoform B [Drosophila mojavensis]|nr:uncharacterized protein Dmoj_GI25521, isoform B [Drosophila mojavensis]